MEKQKKTAPPGEDARLTARLKDPATARKAFEEVVERYSEPLYWQIRRIVQRHEDADDVLQNVLLKAWTSLDGFRGDARLSTWLYKIAINESLSHLEREKRRAAASLDDPDSYEARAIEADEWVDGDELSRELRQVVAALPAKQQLVFNMRYYDEMPYEEMSRILGTSVGALKASYHLAVKKIEQHFKEKE